MLWYDMRMVCRMAKYENEIYKNLCALMCISMTSCDIIRIQVCLYVFTCILKNNKNITVFLSGVYLNDYEYLFVLLCF